MNSSFKEFKVTVCQNEDIIIEPANGNYSYCLFFLHGVTKEPSLYLELFLTEPLIGLLRNFKIIMPGAPFRKVTYCDNSITRSWFDLKIIKDAFSLPFDSVFSQIEVNGNLIQQIESFQRLKVLIDQEAHILNGDYTKIFLSGFSQGCAMSIYTAYELEKNVGGLIGIGGYYLETTRFQSQRNIPTQIIHGEDDPKRVWSDVAKCYDKFIGSEKVILVKGMVHEIYNKRAQELFFQFLKDHTKE